MEFAGQINHDRIIKGEKKAGIPAGDKAETKTKTMGMDGDSSAACSNMDAREIVDCDQCLNSWKETLKDCLVGSGYKEAFQLIGLFLRQIDVSALSDSGQRSMEDMKDKISLYYYSYLEDKLNKAFEPFIDENNKQVLDLRKVINSFVKEVQDDLDDLTDRFKEVLKGVCYAVLRSEYGSYKITSARNALSRSAPTDVEGTEIKEGEIRECSAAARIITKMLKDNPKRNVIKNFLDRLMSLVDKKGGFAARDLCQLYLSALDQIEEIMVDTQDIKADSGQGREESLLLEGILGSRFQSDFKGVDEFNLPIHRWDSTHFKTYLKALVADESFIHRLSYDFQVSIKKIINRGEAGNSQLDKLLDDFKRIARLELDGMLDCASLNIHDNYVYVMVDYLFGERIVSLFNARNAISILSAASRSFRRSVLLRFFDNDEERLNTIIARIKEKRTFRVVIKHSKNEMKVVVWLYGKNEEVIHGMKSTAISQHGVPRKSIAVDIQLIFGKQKMERFYTKPETGEQTIKYFEPIKNELVGPGGEVAGVTSTTMCSGDKGKSQKLMEKAQPGLVRQSATVVSAGSSDPGSQPMLSKVRKFFSKK